MELDVRLSGDDQVVVFHDATVAGSPVRRLPLRALPRSTATLEETLDACRTRGILNVEVKSDAPGRVLLARSVARAVRRAPGAEIVLSSFDPFVVLALAALAPEVPRAILVGGRTARVATTMPVALRRVVEAAHLEDSLATPERVARIRGTGLRVAVWTVNDVDRVRELAREGVAWVITDRPGPIASAVRD